MKRSEADLAAMLEVRGKWSGTQLQRHTPAHPWLKALFMLAVALGLVGLCAGALVWLGNTSGLAGLVGGVFIIVFVLALTAKR